MALRVLRERFGIETVGELREALADIPANMPIGDTLGDSVKLEFLQDMDTDEKEITIS